MTTYNKDNEIIFEPEQEKLFPNQIKTPRPKKAKANMTAKRKSQIKRKLIKITIIAVIVLSTLTCGTYYINKWFESHTIKWQSPIQTPVWVEPRAMQELPLRHNIVKEAKAEGVGTPVTDSKASGAVVQESIQYSSEQIVKTVFKLESSSGKHDGCVTKGLGYNGYGYRQNSTEWKCFGSREEVAGYVAWQFEKYLKTMDLETALCYYNTGSKIKGCQYYKNFLKYN